MCKKSLIFMWVLVVWVAGCSGSGDVAKFKTYLESKDQFKNLVLVKLDYPRSVRTRLHSIFSGLGPEKDYALMGKVENEKELRILFEALYRMDLQDKICLDVEVGSAGVKGGVGTDNQ